jgi:hypothetical protein
LTGSGNHLNPERLRAGHVDDAAAWLGHERQQRLAGCLGAQEVGGDGGGRLVSTKRVALVRNACRTCGERAVVASCVTISGFFIGGNGGGRLVSTKRAALVRSACKVTPKRYMIVMVENKKTCVVWCKQGWWLWQQT